MKNMNAFEHWQVIQVIIGAAQIGALIFAALLAYYVGLKQNEINNHLLRLQDYVAIAATPGDGVIKLINTGKSNLYLWGFDMPGNNQRFKRPRLISAGTNDASYYWLNPPPNVTTITTSQDFEFKLYLTDEFDNKWISEHGGEATPTEVTQNGKKEKATLIKVWSYKTYQYNWSFYN